MHTTVQARPSLRIAAVKPKVRWRDRRVRASSIMIDGIEITADDFILKHGYLIARNPAARDYHSGQHIELRNVSQHGWMRIDHESDAEIRWNPDPDLPELNFADA